MLSRIFPLNNTAVGWPPCCLINRASALMIDLMLELNTIRNKGLLSTHANKQSMEYQLLLVFL